MLTFYEHFMACGWVSFVMLLGGIAAWPLAVAACFSAWASPRRGHIVAASSVVFALVVLGIGGGTELAQCAAAEVEARALADDPADAAHVKRIEHQLEKDAASCTTLGLWFGGMPALMSAVALAVALKRRRAARIREALDSERLLDVARASVGP